MDGDGAEPTAEDRERATGVLRERMASGRLSLGEYQARLRRVKAAATAAELDAVVRDLRDPAADRDDGEGPAGSGDASAPSAGPQDGARPSRGGCAGVLAVSAICAAAYAVRVGRAG